MTHTTINEPIVDHHIDRATLEDTQYPSVSLFGPVDGTDTRYRIEVDGYDIPYIVAIKPNANKDEWFLSLDNRFGTEAMTEEDIKKQAWFWANAMAVAAGYTAHGVNSCINKHGPTMM